MGKVNSLPKCTHTASTNDPPLHLESFLLHSVGKPQTLCYFMPTLEGVKPNTINCSWGYAVPWYRHTDSLH